MAWIKTHQPDGTNEELREAMQKQADLYPIEYSYPVEAVTHEDVSGSGIVLAHSLLPQTLYHAFATYGTLLSPDLPLTRRQHEMIAATVSALNRCFY